jgi:nicotinamide mononucleotide transporter
VLQDLTTLEIIGTISLALYVILAARESPWCWPVSILGVICSMIVMYRKQVYLEVGLNLYYMLISIFAIWYWIRGGKQGGHLQISKTTQREWIGLVLFAIVGSVALALFIDNVPEVIGLTPTDVAWPDAITIVLSLGATYLLVRKRIENWFVWIIADAIYVPLMMYKEAYFFAGLYGFYLLACVLGLITWSRHMKAQIT